MRRLRTSRRSSRSKTGYRQKSALIKRAAAEAFFAMRTFMALLKRLQRGDVAVSVTTPFMLPYAVAAAARLKRARSALIMHDLYPDVLVMAGLLKPASLPARAIRAANALMLRALDAVVIIGRDTERPLLGYSGITPGKIRFIPNWATLAPGRSGTITRIAARMPPALWSACRAISVLPTIP
jgi:colanic acid biosynthesis glycosyl transferase WcaI